MGKPIPSYVIPLKRHVLIEPFEKISLYMVGPINAPSKQKTYILVWTIYVKIWVEDKRLPFSTENVVVIFLSWGYFHCFLCPKGNCDKSRCSIHNQVGAENYGAIQG